MKQRLRFLGQFDVPSASLPTFTVPATMTRSTTTTSEPPAGTSAVAAVVIVGTVALLTFAIASAV